MSELDQLFDKPMEINLSEARKGEVMKPVGPVQLFCLRLLSFVGAGVLLWQAGIIGMRFAFDLEDPMININADESKAIARIHRYCYNAVPVLNDREICEESWKKYRELDAYMADGPVTATQHETAEAGFDKKGLKHGRWEAQAEAAEIPLGNAKSPAR